MKLKEEDILSIYIVIASVYTSSALLPNIRYLLKNSTNIFHTFKSGFVSEDEKPKEKKKTEKEKVTKLKVFLLILREAAMLLVATVARFLIIFIIVFFVLLAVTDVTFMDNFQKTFVFLDPYFWKGGDLLIIYIPFLLSLLVVLIVVSLYIVNSKSFIKDLKYADLNKKEDTKDEDEEGFIKNSYSIFGDSKIIDDAIDETSDDINSFEKVFELDLSKMEMFRRYFMLLMTIIMLFLFMFLFIHYWDTDKTMFAMYMSFLIILMLCAIISMKQGLWNLIFYAGILLCAGANWLIIRQK